MAENRKDSVQLGIVNHMQSDLEVMALEVVPWHSFVGMVASEAFGWVHCAHCPVPRPHTAQYAVPYCSVSCDPPVLTIMDHMND